MSSSRVVHWLRAHPDTADALLAALVAGLSVVFHLTEHGNGYHRPSVWGVLLSLAATAPVAFRRRAPVTVFAVVLVSQALLEAWNYVGPGGMGVLIALYSVGSQRGGVVLWRVTAVALPLLMGFVLLGVVRGDAPWQAMISTPVMFLSALVLGDNMRRRRERAAHFAERAEHLERERALEAHQHVQEERARIARELHDVVAHSVSLMVIQAGAARRQLKVDPARADEALATVEDTGRQAMQEMRRILGVLRDDTGARALEPQPSLADIGRVAGAAPDLPVVVRTAGDLTDLPTGVELSAYRIVQEALTNVRRHAGPVQKVEVSLTRTEQALTVEVCDDGRGASAAASSAGATEGFGIVGMKERAAAYDGGLLAGPRPGGGWRVKAVFPVRAG